jgi:AraC family transcriptional regulator of adaptative response / DNA-3-methyladenine glycosylase II
MTGMTQRLPATWDKALARRGHYDGAFVVGWMSSGIYHLPSCPLRAKKSEDIRTFSTEAAAQAAGLRACKTCRPDRYYENRDDVAVFERMRRDVDEGSVPIRDVRSLAKRAGLTVVHLDDLCRDHAQLTPAAWLAERTMRKATHALIRTRHGIDEIAGELGFAKPDVFAKTFCARMGMTPEDYRQLDASRGFALLLPKGYRPTEILAYHARYPASVSERSEGNRIWKALMTPDGAAVLELTLNPAQVRAQIHADAKLSRASVAELHASAIAMLGLTHDVTAFERQHAALARDRRGLRLPLLPTAFDALCWGIVGQQINVRFAGKLRQVLIELAGQQIGEMRAHPTPEALARLSVDDLANRQFSRAKARYLIDAAQAVATGRLDIEGLRDRSAIAAEKALTAQRGIGVWTARYMLLRLGFADIAPIGDSALATGLERMYRLPHRPDARQTARLMSDFAPYRSLATAHLWASLKSAAKSVDDASPKVVATAKRATRRRHSRSPV